MVLRPFLSHSVGKLDKVATLHAKWFCFFPKGTAKLNLEVVKKSCVATLARKKREKPPRKQKRPEQSQPEGKK